MKESTQCSAVCCVWCVYEMCNSIFFFYDMRSSNKNIKIKAQRNNNNVLYVNIWMNEKRGIHNQRLLSFNCNTIFECSFHKKMKNAFSSENEMWRRGILIAIMYNYIGEQK